MGYGILGIPVSITHSSAFAPHLNSKINNNHFAVIVVFCLGIAPDNYLMIFPAHQSFAHVISGHHVLSREITMQCRATADLLLTDNLMFYLLPWTMISQLLRTAAGHHSLSRAITMPCDSRFAFDRCDTINRIRRLAQMPI